MAAQAQWQIKDPRVADSDSKYSREMSVAYGYSLMYSDMMSFLNNQEATLKQIIEQDATEDWS